MYHSGTSGSSQASSSSGSGEPLRVWEHIQLIIRAGYGGKVLEWKPGVERQEKRSLKQIEIYYHRPDLWQDVGDMDLQDLTGAE